MNQILATENNKNKKKSSGPIAIKPIVRFFAVVIIIFGIILIGEGSYAIYENNSLQDPKNAPKVSISRQNDKAVINVEHNIDISKIVYHWDNGEETVIPIGSNTANETITLLGYDSTLYIMVEDVNGKQSNYAKQYKLNGVDIKKPELETNTVDGNKNMTITAKDNVALKTLIYQWEGEEPVVVNIDGTPAIYEHNIELVPGTRKITITAEDTNGNIEQIEREVIATTAEPNIQVQLLGDGKFYVKVADEDGVASISINLNGEILSLDNINQKEVQTNELTLREGLNTVSITVTNVSGYTKTQAADIKYPY